MSGAVSYRDLDVWNVGMDLAVAAYRLADALPSSERYELSKQIRACAASVPANVAEGQATGFIGMFLRHVAIALGSVAELDTHVELAVRLDMLSRGDTQPVNELIARTGKLLHGTRRALRLKLTRKVGLVIALWSGLTQLVT